MRRKWDWVLFSLIGAIGSISVLVIFSINSDLATSQLIFWIFGLLTLFLFANFDYRIWQKLAPFFYVAAIASLLLLLLIGDPIRGSTRWIDLGFFRFQPSEITKVAAIFMLASFYYERTARVLKNLLAGFLVVLPAIILVFLEPDIGNSLAFIAIWLGVSSVAGFKIKHLIWLFIIAAFGLIALYQLLAPYQKNRIITFVNPYSDPLGTGYNIIQSKIAIGSGQFLGRGLGYGSQSLLKFLPESESDFIFASITEQLGFIGSLLLLVFFALFVLRIISYAKRSERFGQLIIAGSVSFLMAQFTINIGMNMALFPVTGITLPLVSYGGSSLISTLLLLGAVFSIGRLNVERASV